MSGDFNKKECLNQISAFCKKRIKAGMCGDGDCEFCCINDAYEAIEDETFGEKSEDCEGEDDD